MSSTHDTWTFHDYKRACDYVLHIESETTEITTMQGYAHRMQHSITKYIVQFFWEGSLEVQTDISDIKDEHMEAVYEFLDNLSNGRIDMSIEDLRDYLDL